MGRYSKKMKKSLGIELKTELKSQGADFVHFVNISQLSWEQNKGYPNAILIGMTLSPGFIREISGTMDYLKKTNRIKPIKMDEFHQTESQTDSMADDIAEYLIKIGYSAYSQSEDNIYSTGFYDEKAKTTPLPHKTIAGLAGLGWIGKHNLLVTSEFGSAVSMCTVLTDAPLKTVLHSPVESQCGSCSICKDNCEVQAIEGNTWNIRTSRDELLDVNKCDTCLRCLALCPWTQKYMPIKIKNKQTIHNL